jgi:hypothetical protein
MHEGEPCHLDGIFHVNHQVVRAVVTPEVGGRLQRLRDLILPRSLVLDAILFARLHKVRQARRVPARPESFKVCSQGVRMANDLCDLGRRSIQMESLDV